MPAADSASAVAVVGREPVATGNAALHLARAEARVRDVIVVDLIGDAAPLREAVLTDDAHGVADCFNYGVSFAAVSRPSSVDPHIAIIPSGSEPVPYADALPSARWQRFIDDARGHGALVVFAALLDTPQLDALIARVDHVIPAALVVAPAPTAPVLGPVRSTIDTDSLINRRRRVVRKGLLNKELFSKGLLGTGLLGKGLLGGRRRAMATAIIAAVIVVGALGSWAALRASSSDRLVPASSVTDTITSTAQLGTRSGEPGAPADGAGSGLVPGLVDPADSAVAALYAMRIGSYPTFAEALRRLRRQSGRPNAQTITPLADSGTRARPGPDGRIPVQRYAVFTGAARSAAALAAAARERAAAGDSGGTAVRTPYALRLADGMKLDSARRATTVWRARGVPAYVLVDNTGSARVYAGAFESSAQAAPLTASLHAIGLAPVLAYRVGLAR